MIEQITQPEILAIIGGFFLVIIILIRTEKGQQIQYATTEQIDESKQLVNTKYNRTKSTFREALEYFKAKDLEIILSLMGVGGILIAIGVETPYYDNTLVDVTLMYIGFASIVAVILGPNIYKRLQTKKEFSLIHAKNPKDRLLSTYDIPKSRLSEVEVVEPYFEDDENEDLAFKELSLSDLESIWIETEWGTEQAYACYRFYPDDMIAIASRRSNMTSEEIEEYEDALEYMDAYDVETRQSFRRLKTGYFSVLDKEADHRLNEFLHDFQDVAFNEEREFKERISHDKDSAISKILDEPISERLDIEHPKESHNKDELADLYEDEFLNGGDEQ